MPTERPGKGSMHYDENTIYWPGRQGLKKLLGDLELEVMEEFWRHAPLTTLTVRDVFEELAARKKIAYTTVMTTMGRLAEKGILSLDRSHFPHHYQAPETREQFTERAVGSILNEILSDFSEPALAHLAKQATGGDRSQELGSLIERLRAEEEPSETRRTRRPRSRER